MLAGCTSYFAGQYDEAIAQLEKTGDVEPHYGIYRWLGPPYEQKRMYGKAIEIYEKGLASAGRDPQLVALRGHAYALAGERDKAQGALAELGEISRQSYVTPIISPT